MTDRPLWERASLPSGVAVATSTRVAGLALVVVALVTLVGGWRWPVSVLLGGAVVLAVLWGSARVLIGGARRLAPTAALLLALGLYVTAVTVLFVLAVVGRPAAGGDGWLRAPGVAAGILTVVLGWTVSLLVVHVRHDRGPRRR